MRVLGLLVAFAAAMFASVAHAAAIPLSLPSNVAQVGSTFVARPGVAFSGAAFNSGLTTQVAGKLVTVPAAWRLASNAAHVAVGVVRGNPAAFAGAIIVSWLLDYGLEQCDNGNWCVRPVPEPNDPGQGFKWYIQLSDWANTFFDGPEEACLAYYNSGAGGAKDAGWTWNGLVPYTSSSYWCSFRSPDGSYVSNFVPVQRHFTECATGYTYASGACVPDLMPATESDWARVNSLPDAVATEMVDKGVAIPLNPEVNPATQVVPLSDPYTDPVTGKRWQDVAHVTPSPSEPTKKADLQVSKQEVDPNGDPVVDPETNQPLAPQEQDDECLKHPNRVGCMEAGDPPEVELEEEEKEVKIEAQGGFGPASGTCPVGESLVVLGQSLTLSWQPMCNLAQSVRPVLLALAWLSAILIALGIYKRAGA